MGIRLAAYLLAASSLVGVTGAHAAAITTDLSSDTYITVGGLDWTWAAPVSSPDWFGFNTLYDPSFHAGWRYATEAEFAARPLASAFVDAGVPGGVRQSAAYWNSAFTHIDYGDGESGAINRLSVPNGSPTGYFESWYVRDAAAPAGVPEPATWLMMLLGFGVIGYAMRRTQHMTVNYNFA